MFNLNGAVSSPGVNTCRLLTWEARLLYSFFTGSITRNGTPRSYNCRSRLNADVVLPEPVLPIR